MDVHMYSHTQRKNRDRERNSVPERARRKKGGREEREWALPVMGREESAPRGVEVKRVFSTCCLSGGRLAGGKSFLA